MGAFFFLWKRNMNILALDLSLSNSGVAVFDSRGNVLELKSINTDKEKTHPLKLKKIAKEFTAIKKKYKPNLVLIEQGFTRFNKSTQAIYKTVGVVNYLFFDVEQIYINVKSIRKALLGNGNAKKDMVQDYILSEYRDLEFKNFDESDAFLLGLAYFKEKGVL